MKKSASDEAVKERISTLRRASKQAERILGIAKISTKAQVTIPLEARKKFALKIGDSLIFAEEDGRLVIRKAW